MRRALKEACVEMGGACKEHVEGIYACYLENFVQPVVSYKFNVMVEGW